MINEYDKEVECKYKGETYSVRDNGAVKRHPRNGKRPRPTDNIWTFGKYNPKTGYAEIAGERIHRIVATAFHGEAPSPQYVVDHIDTNRRNNRPENLRWITKLENILLNPITAKRIELACGSVEEFLKDPSKLRQNYVDRDFEWMRAVSKEEAASSLERLLNWANSEKTYTNGGSLGEWIYARSTNKNVSTKKDIIETNNAETKDDLVVNEEYKEEQKDKSVFEMRPFKFPRSVDGREQNGMRLYITKGEVFQLIKEKLVPENFIKLPDVKLPTAGKGIVVKKSWTIKIETTKYNYEGKARIPSSIIVDGEGYSFAVIFRMVSKRNEKEINRLKEMRIDIVELDMSWAKNGITEDELNYILNEDVSKKEWLSNSLIEKAKEKLMRVSEPITCAGTGVLHGYIACPRCSDSVQDIDCWYCDFAVDSESIGSVCFGKADIQTYEDLLSVVDVEKEDEKIVSISFNKNGKVFTKKFDKEVQLRGKTLFELWDKRKRCNLYARNIYSGWCVLIEDDPNISYEKEGKVYARLGRETEKLKTGEIRSIYSFDSCCWEEIE